MSEFWKSAGFHLVARDARGWLTVTPDYLRAYLARPEMRPVAESCEAEHRLFDSLLEDPFRPVAEGELDRLADPDAAENYGILLGFRDHLVESGTLEQAYSRLFAGTALRVPPIFVDQLVHVILRNILSDVRDPMRLRAAELFFRDQKVSLQEGRVMLADEETVDTFAETGGMGGLGQLLMESNTPLRAVSLDVLNEENKATYWERSDRFDTVVDFRFTEPVVDAFARVVEAWVKHFVGLDVRVHPVPSIADERWSWHIGLDSEATRLLNALYEGRHVSLEELQQVLALFRMEILDRRAVIETMRGKPVYLALAMTPGAKVKMKPQNLLVNLPLPKRS
jgi:hypothetical protein